MEKKASSLPLLLAGMALGGLATLGASIVYMVTKTDPVVIKEIKAERFEDLPLEIQRDYLHKNELPTIAALGMVPSTTKELTVGVETPIEGGAEELRAQVLTLREKNRFLYQDNMDLANKNWELAIRLNQEQKALEEERQKLQVQSLEFINQAEQQHYQNINDLTRRITTLQQESMRSSKEYETKIVSLENTVYELQKALREKGLQIDTQVSLATKEQRISNSTLAEKNRYLLEQHKVLQENMNALLDEKEKALRESKSETDQLRVLLREKEGEYNVILTNHTRDILAQERKHNEAIQKLVHEINTLKQTQHQEILAKNNEIDGLMHTHETSLNTLRGEAIALESRVQQERMAREKIEETHKEALENLQTQLANQEAQRKKLNDQIKEIERIAQERISQKDREYAKALDELRQQSLGGREQETALIASLRKQVETHSAAALQAQEEKQALAEEISTLKASLSEAGTKLSNAITLNEAKHAKNYQELHEKIVHLEKERAVLIDKTLARLDALAKEKEELATLRAKAEKAFQEERVSLQARYEKLEKENASLKLGQDKQLLALKEEFESLQLAFKKREKEYEATIAQLNTALLQERSESQNLLKEAMLKKPELLETITCDDMESGTNEPSLSCKNRVSAFLKAYNPSYFFEVLPIVDDGGFATLRRIEGDTRLNVPKEEIGRLTRLSNLGLGKDRAAAGGKLIENHFDGLARVSYASEIVEVPSKRGFVIRVYR